MPRHRAITTTQKTRVTEGYTEASRGKSDDQEREFGHMGVTDARLAPISNEQPARRVSPHLACRALAPPAAERSSE